MRILLTCDPFLPVPPLHYGGIERIVAGLVGRLRRHGHEVGLVAHPDSSAATDFFLGWPRTTLSAAAHVGNMLALSSAVGRFRPSLIHSFSRLMYLAPQLPRHTPKVMSYQRFAGGQQIALAARAAGASLRFTGCSAFIAAMGSKFGGAWQVIPNFVDIESYTFVATVPKDAPLVFLGRVESVKGAHVAIEIAKRAGRRLIIAGNRCERGAEADYWDSRIKPEIGRNGIDYVGPVDDQAKNELLGSAAAMVAPIQWDEPFGIVFAEAMACGTPVITCRRGAAPEIVRDTIDGFLIRDVDDGARAVERLPAIDRRNCRRRAEQAFSVAVVVPQYETLYSAMARRAL